MSNPTKAASSGNGMHLPTTTSAYLLIRQLASELYTRDQCLKEMFRNCVYGCMPRGEYKPDLVRVEITLVPNHPLSPGRPALLILDYGRGFTDADFKNFGHLGPTGQHGTEYLYGGSQKCIGRLGGLNLVRAIHEDEDIHSGYYVITRTSAKGRVKFLHYTPYGVETNTLSIEELNPDSSELGQYRNIKGSFSLIVIPDTVYKSAEEVRSDLIWHLPRTKDMLMSVKVNGEPIQPPPLEKNFKQAGKIKAYLGRAKVGDNDYGIWLVDADTGFRCAFAQHLTDHQLPYPLRSRDLKGEIIIPGLLNKQNANRGSLSPKFLRSAEWRKIRDTLLLHFCEFAQDLLGDDDVFNPNDPSEAMMMDIADMFDAAFGVPEIEGGDLPGVVAGDRKLPPDEPKKKGDKRPTKRLRAGHRKHPSEGKVRGRAITIDGETYILRKSPNMGPMKFAEVVVPKMEGSFEADLRAPKEIRYNPMFLLKCGSPKADQEHRLWRVLTAVNMERVTDPTEVELNAAETRSKLGKGKKKSPPQV
ncbi:MAG: hypothetical protein P1P90_06735 [Patescibacteria group bacterium]|nr:hypothetical protein [Patescibacteria group bacterium]